MYNISLAILCVGLVANNTYLKSKGIEGDFLVALFAVISAVVLLVK